MFLSSLSDVLPVSDEKQRGLSFWLRLIHVVAGIIIQIMALRNFAKNRNRIIFSELNVTVNHFENYDLKTGKTNTLQRPIAIHHHDCHKAKQCIFCKFSAKH